MKKYQPDPRKKSRGPEISNGGVQEKVSRIMAQVQAGEKVVPLSKDSLTVTKTPRSMYPDHEMGICSGCTKTLFKTSDGRVFHAPGVSTDCKHGTVHKVQPEPYEEIPTRTVKITTTAGSHYTITIPTVGFFAPFDDVDPEKSEIDVPDWCFFGSEFV